MIFGGTFVRYLYGDSTESDLETNFLAFLRDVFDCVVVMLEAEHTLAANVERRKVREQQVAGMIRAVEELGKDAAAVVEPIAKEQSKAPVGRCAAAIASAIRDAVARESSQAKGELANARSAVDEEDNQARLRAYSMLEKLLRTHDLPGAEKDYEIVSSGHAAKALMRQHAAFGLDVAVELEVPANSIYAGELRVERIDSGVEVHAVESGGWLKKTDKLVAHKLGRYQVIAVSVDADTTTIKLRANPDTNGTGLTITVKRNGQIAIVGSGSNANKEFSVEERDRPGIKGLIDKLVAALRALEKRSALVAADFEGRPITDITHPRVIADRFISAIAPTVQKIVRHSRSPGELVLRRKLADDRREEIYVPIDELARKAEVLPKDARAAFAPLGLGIGIDSGGNAPAPAKAFEPKPEPKPAVSEPKSPAMSMPLRSDVRVPAPDSKSPFGGEAKPVEIKPFEATKRSEPKLPLVDAKIAEAKWTDENDDDDDDDVGDGKPVEVKHSNTRPLDLKNRDGSARTGSRDSSPPETGERKTRDTKPPEFKPIEPNAVEARPEAKLSDVRTAPRTSPPLVLTAPRSKPPSNPPGSPEGRLSPPIAASAIAPNAIQRDKGKSVPPPGVLLRESSPGFKVESPRPEGSQPAMRTEPMLSASPAGSAPSKIEIVVDDDDDEPPMK